MWVLVYVISTAVLITGYFLVDIQSRTTAMQIDTTVHISQQTASLMVQVMSECAKRGSAGYYPVSSLMPAGFPVKTPAGPGIICVVRASGTLATGRSAFVYLDSDITNIPTSGLTGAEQAKKGMAYMIAGRLARQIAGHGSTTNQLPDTIAGVVERGSPAPTLIPTMQGKNSLDLNGVMVPNFPYSTPVLAAGVLSSSI